MREKTPFIARRWAGAIGGEGLTAILPTIPGNGPTECACYDIPGQHGTTYLWQSYNATAPATPEETEQLRKELEQVGYPNPKPYTRMTQRMARERRQNWRAMMDHLDRHPLPDLESEEIPA